MNQARRAFEKFEKSDSWLPVILLSITGVVATITVVSVATQLQAKSARTAGQVFYFIGKSIGFGLVHEPTGRKLEEHEISNVVIDGIGKVQGWGRGHTFLAAFDWSPTWSPDPNEVTDTTTIAAYCWIADGNRSLLVTAMVKEPESTSSELSGARLGAVQMLSIDSKTERLLITNARENLPAAPWESVVTLDKDVIRIEPEELFSAHAEHIAGKELSQIRVENVNEWLLKALERKNLWMIERGGLSPEELDTLLTRENPLFEINSARSRAAFQLGIRAAIAERATQLALDAYSELAPEMDLSNMVAIHPCNSPVELDSQMVGKSSARLVDELLPDEHLQELIDEATQNGVELKARTDELIGLLESEGIATKVHELSEPIEATIYELKAQDDD